MASVQQPGLETTSKPLVIHTPVPSRSVSPQKLPALEDNKDDINNNSDSGVFTSEPENKENKTEMKKQGKRQKRVLKRKPISYRVKKKPEEDDNLNSTDSSLDLKDGKAPGLPPVNNKNLLKISERPEFVSPRTPQKLPSIKSQEDPPRKRGNNKLVKGRKTQSQGQNKSNKEVTLINNEAAASSEAPPAAASNKTETRAKTDLSPAKRHKQRLAGGVRRSLSEDTAKDREILRNRRLQSRQKTEDTAAAPTTADTLVVDVRSQSSHLSPRKSPRKDRKRLTKSDGLISSRSASIRDLHSSHRPVLSSKLGKKKTVAAVKEEDLKSPDKHLTLLKLDETFTKDDFGNKSFPPMESVQRDLARTDPRLSLDQDLPSKDAAGNTLEDTIEKMLEQADFVHCDSLPELIHQRLQTGDPYIRSLSNSDDWFLQNLVKSMIMFGLSLKLNTRTQAMVWMVMTRLAGYWSKHGKVPPSEEELLEDKNTLRFLLKVSKLCLNLITTDQEQVTAVQEVIKTTDDQDQEVMVTLIKFEMFDITLSRARLESFSICEIQDKTSKNMFSDPLDQFVVCKFDDGPMVEFLAGVCLHIYDHFYDDIPQLSPPRQESLLPVLCGISSVAKDKEQNLVINFVEKLSSVTYIPIRRDSEFFLHQRQLREVWSSQESPLLLFLCVYEARMKNIHDKHPSSESELSFVESRLENHHLIIIGYYLSHIDKKHAKMTTFSARGCELSDESLEIFSSKLIKLKTVNLNRNNFTEAGIKSLMKKIEEHKDDGSVQLESLELSQCCLDDSSLISLSPIVNFVSELILNDNHFTRFVTCVYIAKNIFINKLSVLVSKS